ncbi:MAG: bifunctional DNA primase/polymerase [Candidatus Portnoybacteria bacterium]|nr:bifunctional DNA primase/polymerase [Candidatus Portnoybacteria bacterium]
MNKSFETAKQYTSSHWSIIPIERDGKLPAIKEKDFVVSRRNRLATEAEMKNWFLDNDYNVAIITGDFSGLLVVDCDNGFNIRDFNFPKTFCVETPRGGMHFYYRCPKDIGCHVGLLPHLDIRANGGYVLCPPSVIDGKSYRWAINSLYWEQRIAEPPKWLLNLLTKKKSESKDWEKITAGARIGERNQTLASLSGLLFRYIPKDKWESAIVPLLEIWNQYANQPPLPSGEFKTTIRSIAAKELTQKNV